MSLHSRLNRINDKALAIMARKRKEELFRKALEGQDISKPLTEKRFKAFTEAILYNNPSIQNRFKA